MISALENDLPLTADTRFAMASVTKSFTAMSVALLVEMLTYKAELAGMQVVKQEESYTSKCSFLDGEFPQKRTGYAGVSQRSQRS